MVRAPASHHCCPDLIPGPGITCGLSFLLVLVLACSEGLIYSGFSGFPPSTKFNTSKFYFDLETVDEEPVHGNTNANFHYFLYFFLFNLSSSFHNL